MANDEAVKTPESPLQQLCERAKVGDEAKALLTDESSTKQFIGLLVEKELFRDAIRLIAHLLPKREAIGWGCLCVRHILATQKDMALPEVQIAAERWVSAPTEENRWAAKQAADKEDPKTPSGLLAMAVFFAGPTMAPPNLQAVPPPGHATSEVVAGVVVLAGVVKEPEKAKERYDVFVQKALALVARMQQPQQQ
ncbi:MAG TPA: hypothetical protein VEN79_11100 [Terriglobia bacterium]|nr:hypothetical protein [Terriglobia bacterium]